MVNMLFIFVLTCVFSLTVADTPANCTYEDIRGKWLFSVGETNFDSSVDCTSMGEVKSKTVITLQFPDVAVDNFGNKGFWTIIYNQGFEVVIHGRKYFAFSKYEGSLSNSTSFCDCTLPGWTHTVGGKQWGCYVGKKLTSVAPKQNYRMPQLFDSKLHFKSDPDFVAEINQVQNTWKAVVYKEHHAMTVGDILRRSGGRASVYSPPSPASVTAEVQSLVDELPTSFDWRNVKGMNFVSNVRNQGSCGSCYAFASVGMNEARLRIVTNNTRKLIFSPQDIVECGQYSQGCDGGFPYLVGGKYTQDFGMVQESCRPYTGHPGQCTTAKTCTRQYVSDYKYVGGYYGGCNEKLMQLALISRGPLAVSFEVYPDFMHYHGGVYQHSGVSARFNPFHLTNHAVLLVGYGVDAKTSLPYWLVQNSWGEEWGEKGFFRIRRGVNECAIESIAVESVMAF